MKNRKSFLNKVILELFLGMIICGCSLKRDMNLAELEQLTREQSEKVQQALRPLNIPLETWQIKRVRSSQPIAASFKNYLLLSDGIFSRMASVSELSFILAHEFAHKELKHELSDKPTLGLEKEADKAALFKLLRAHINPRSSITALSRMIESSPPNDSDLSIIKRIQALTPLIP